jgi:hypothetical protein
MHCKNIIGFLAFHRNSAVHKMEKLIVGTWIILSGLKGIVSLTLSVEGTTLWRLRRKIVFWANIKSDVRERGEGRKKKIFGPIRDEGGGGGGETTGGRGGRVLNL